MSTGKPKTILLVEDNPDLQAATADLLGTLGYQTAVTRTIAQALAAVQRERFDLVIANAYPGQGSGLDIVDQIRAVVPHLPALLVSGFGDDLELRHRAISGDVGFLPIPFSAESLEARIEETLERGPAAIAQGRPVPRQSPGPLAAGGWGTRSRPWLAAAAVALAAGLAFQFVNRPPEMPAFEVGDPRRGHEIELLEPVGDVGGRPGSLAWRESPGAARYRVVLMAVDLTELWETETRETSIALPESVSDQLHGAVSYFWQVEGFAADSSRTGRSSLTAFRFAPRGPA